MENKDLFTDETNKSLLAAFAWWEKRRLIYNLIVGAVGILILIYANWSIDVSEIIGIIFYGVTVNLFYCLGFIFEVAAKYYFKSNDDFSKHRNSLFVLGVILSFFITIGIASVLAII